MSDWLPPGRREARAAAAHGPLAPLARSLAAELEPVLDMAIELPREKARLSRAGGRCPRDAAMLTFDPRSPRRHRCPTCGAEYDDEAHYRWWIMGFHLWLAERAVHAAALHALAGDERHARFAADVLARYADAYLRWPNVDNVLGPTRPFFSTYLESIWLLQLCVALALLEGARGREPVGQAVRERLIAPSAALVAVYDEGRSNRQVWNNAAMLAAARLLGDAERAELCVWASGSGLVAHLEDALLADGTWYEGENYHLFAHRGLWYGVQLADAAGLGTLPPALLRRFDEGFATPFLTALPDFTFPSRRDSQYAVSLRQWRFAELAELGLARNPHDRRLRDALARLYDGSGARRDTGRWRSTAEAERNEPAAALDRAELGWRSLLFALPELPPLHTAAPGSVLLDAQGFAVLRREAGRVYAALDYGVSGGGHGHPDRLGVMLAVGDERWLDDPGTGSYVDPSLHWYRSTLAHNAPLVDGRSQPAADGVLLAAEERGGAGWVSASVGFAEPSVTLRRAIVVMPDYLVDELRWEAARDVTVDLPVHAPGSLDGVAVWERADPPFEGGAYLRDVERAAAPSAEPARLVRDGAASPAAWFLPEGDVEWWRATAPGAPGRADAPMHVARLRGARGVLRTVWSWRGAVVDATLADDALHVAVADGARHVHTGTSTHWHVDLVVGSARSSIDLAGARPTPAPRPRPHEVPPGALPPAPSEDFPLVATLEEPHYRRSELSWREAGAPTATVALHLRGEHLVFEVAVRRTWPSFVPAGAVNEMDNERPEINGAGVQLHVAVRGANGAAPVVMGWLLVPDADHEVRVVPLDPLAEAAAVVAGGWPAEDGYSVHAAVELWPARHLVRGLPAALGLDVLVNETAPGRERRRGQLVLSGARGEFVYLRGDRHDPARMLWFRFPDG